MYEVIETFSEAKSTAMPSEDGVAVTVSYAAVIDGATAKTNPDTPQATAETHPDTPQATAETPGHLAMTTLRSCIAGFPPGLTATQAAEWMTEAMRALWELYPDDAAARPVASVVLYSDARREVWQIGDCPFLLDGEEHRGAKSIDRLLASWRARATRRLLAAGADPAWVRRTDAGREAIVPLLRRQALLQNADPSRRRSFGVVDGNTIPDTFIRVYPLSPGVHHLVLASDGYPRLFNTWSESETHLHALLQQDPLCIGSLLGTKCVRPGANSFDDRTFLSLKVW